MNELAQQGLRCDLKSMPVCVCVCVLAIIDVHDGKQAAHSDELIWPGDQYFWQSVYTCHKEGERESVCVFSHHVVYWCVCDGKQAAHSDTLIWSADQYHWKAVYTQRIKKQLEREGI